MCVINKECIQVTKKITFLFITQCQIHKMYVFVASTHPIILCERFCT